MTRDDFRQVLRDLPAAGVFLLGLGAFLALLITVVPQ